MAKKAAKKAAAKKPAAKKRPRRRPRRSGSRFAARALRRQAATGATSGGARQLDMRRLPDSTGGRRPFSGRNERLSLSATSRAVSAGDSVASAGETPASGRPSRPPGEGDTPWPRKQQRRPPRRSRQPRRPRRRQPRSGKRCRTVSTSPGRGSPRPVLRLGRGRARYRPADMRLRRAAGSPYAPAGPLGERPLPTCGAVTPSQIRIRVMVSPTSSRSTTSMPVTTSPNTV